MASGSTFMFVVANMKAQTATKEEEKAHLKDIIDKVDKFHYSASIDYRSTITEQEAFWDLFHTKHKEHIKNLLKRNKIQLAESGNVISILLTGKARHTSIAHSLCNKIDASSMKFDFEKACYFALYSKLFLVKYASYKLSYKYLQKALMYSEKDMQFLYPEIISKYQIFGVDMLYRLGKYQQYLQETIHHPLDLMYLLSLFHLEQYDVVECAAIQFDCFEKDNTTKESHQSLVYSLRIFCNIKCNQIKKAKKLLKECALYTKFQNNPIANFCSYKLNKEHLYSKYDLSDDWIYLQFFYMFKGMILQFQTKNYPRAILMYHQSNFYGTHAIHYYRLYQCYLKLGLYLIALKYLNRANIISDGNIDTISQNYSSNKKDLLLVIQKLKCNNCGQNYDEENNLFACAGCINVYYCSKYCQKIGWSQCFHRNQCDKWFLTYAKKIKTIKTNCF